MAKINDGTFVDFKDGDKMTSDAYEQDRRILQVAINDNDSRIANLSTGQNGIAGRVSTLETDNTTNKTKLTTHENKLVSLEQKDLTHDNRLDDVEQSLSGYFEPITFQTLEQQGTTFQDFQLGYLDNKITFALGDTNKKAEGLAINVQYPPNPLVGAKGDGTTDDTTAIQSIFNLAKTVNSLSVKFPAGTYRWTSTLRIYKNTKVECDENTIILRGHAASILVNGDSGDSFTGYNGNGNISWTGGTFDGNVLQFPYGANHLGLARGKNLNFRNITFKDVINDHVFDINACDNVLIENCKFIGFKDNTSDHSRDFSEAIQISNHTQLGFTGFGAWDGTPTRNVRVIGCYFGNSETAGMSAWATGVGGHGAVHNLYNSNILVQGCTFDGLTYAGVRDFKFRDMKVVNNTFLGCAYGIVFSNVAPGTESSKDGSGVESGKSQSGDGLLIQGNVFRDTSKVNIFINGQVTTDNLTRASNITIANNHFINQSKSAYDNIYLKWADSVTFTNNVLKGAYRMMKISYCTNVYVDNNHFEDSKYDGVWAFDDSTEFGGSVQNLGYTGNIFIRNNKFVNLGRPAVDLRNTWEFTVSGNDLYNVSNEADGTKDAITTMSASKNGRIHNNKIRMGATNRNNYGINVVTGCTNVQTFNNDAEGKTAKQVNASDGFEGFYMQSPDGTRYKVTVANGGTFTVTAG